MGIFFHQEQILSHHDHWNRKRSLRTAYHCFYRLIASNLSQLPDELVVELGSGIGGIRDVIPQAVTTDLFPTPWSDLVENAYALSFGPNTVSDLILVDVFHHLRYPGTALAEFHRVLRPGGRLIMMEPCISALGLIVFGLLHPEGVRFPPRIDWFAPPTEDLTAPQYHTSQANATAIFFDRRYESHLRAWTRVDAIRLSALSYLATGGYTRPQVLTDGLLARIRRIEHWFDHLPAVFATRLFIILTK